ncbi:MAG: YHYH protein [Reichenbachiella sp.]|uniref:YHYH protein n=1 Tax=Reichenbachiella sp. TaxID=2184521 RepID=UPI0032657B9E
MRFLTYLLCITVLLSCSNGGSDDSDGTDSGELAAAFAVFNEESVTILLDGDEVLIESTGLPNHTSPYWSPDHELYVEATVAEGLAPGYIDDFNGSYSVTLPASPTKSSSTSATSLGAIGIAVSGAMIYNDSEGPNVPLDDAASSLDYSGAHTGPQSYHYHLEPVAWSDDDDELIGVISDGFFLYGRKCTSIGDYPSDLDESGGHTSTTKYNSDEEEYHYHIQNELYLNQYYILFPGDYQGTPNAIN